MDFLALMQSRYTAKHYDPSKKIPAALFEELMEMVRLTPSAVNVQPWKFLTGSSEAVKARLTAIMPEFNKPRIADCSHFVILTVRKELSSDFLEKLSFKELTDGRFADEAMRRARAEHCGSYVRMHQEKGDVMSWSIHQAYIAMATLLYGAASLGIDSTPIEGVDLDILDHLFNLQDKGLQSVAIVSLGYRAENDANAIRPKSRLAREDVIDSLD